MIKRSVKSLIGQPSVIFVSLFIALFFFFVNEASFGRIMNFIPGLKDMDHIAFLLPFTFISVSLNSPAGMEIVRDINSGYFDKLLLKPVKRIFLLISPIVASAIVKSSILTIALIISLSMGLTSASGWAGIFALYGLSIMLNMAFASFLVGIALISKNPLTTQSAGLVFFPLTWVRPPY